MKDSQSSRKVIPVTVAILAVVLLAGSLAARLLAPDPSSASTAPNVANAAVKVTAPPAVVPDPRPIDLKDLAMPCWSCPNSDTWPLSFRTDLDVIAPLGTGTANAALWFKDFTKDTGARIAEAKAANDRRTDHATLGKVLPADDPLLIEAEPWVNQASMRFYPDFYQIEGMKTVIPNLLFPLNLSRSWIARGMANPNDAAALADFRRAIRFGRLLRQDDVTVIADLVGLACIRIGSEAIYDRARAMGDTKLALVASVVLAEATPQRLLTRAKITETDITRFMSITATGEIQLALPDREFKAGVDLVKNRPDRRYRFEAMTSLSVIHTYGTQSQREQARALFDEMVKSDDPLLAQGARSFRDTPPPTKDLIDALGKVGK